MTGGAAGIRPPAGGTSGAAAVIPLDPAISSRQVSVPDLPGVPLEAVHDSLLYRINTTA